jgi:hypothetical protein
MCFPSQKAEERQKVRGSQPAGHFARMINISWSAFVTVSVSQRIGPRRRQLPPKRPARHLFRQIIIASPYRHVYMNIWKKWKKYKCIDVGCCLFPSLALRWLVKWPSRCLSKLKLGPLTEKEAGLVACCAGHPVSILSTY